MKLALVGLLLLPSVLFAQIQQYAHGFSASVDHKTWSWVSFPNITNPAPLGAKITTTVQPTVTKSGSSWVITFPPFPAKSPLDARVEAKQQQRQDLLKKITRIEKEYFVKSNGRGVSETTPEGQQIKSLEQQVGALANDIEVLKAKRELEKK